jgi:hypothetical protein
MGMSLGKSHALGWTVSGRIFSWGCKNLALGLKNYDKVNNDIFRVTTMRHKKWQSSSQFSKVMQG